MPTAIIIIDIIIGAKAIFPRPVDLEIAEGRAIQTAQEGHHVRVGLDGTEIGAVLVEITLLLPEIGDARIVHPAVEAGKIAVDVQRAEGEGSPQPRDVTRIDDAARLGRTARMPLAGSHLIMPRVGGLPGVGEPQARRLPEQLRKDLQAILAGDGGSAERERVGDIAPLTRIEQGERQLRVTSKKNFQHGLGRAEEFIGVARGIFEDPEMQPSRGFIGLQAQDRLAGIEYGKHLAVAPDAEFLAGRREAAENAAILRFSLNAHLYVRARNDCDGNSPPA